MTERLRFGDTIGLISPSHVAMAEHYAPFIAAIEAKGFRVKLAKNLYKATYGYLASDGERADDLNEMAADPEVKLVFFGGGDGSVDLLPLIDYAQIKRTPKLYLSYSDGTTILNAIHARTGLVTYYGQMPGLFDGISDYNYEQFLSHMVRGDARAFVPNSEWRSICPGACEGTLIGGYLLNFALMLRGPYLRMEKDRRYVLFLEDFEKFFSVAAIDAFLSHIEQSECIRQVAGLLFGHYSEVPCPELYARLERFGARHGVPVAYCDDFGHGANHAILPIGVDVALDATRRTMRFLGA